MSPEPTHFQSNDFEFDSANMGWLRLVGSIKLQVSFAKEPYKRDAILHKRPIIQSILLTITTPCIFTSDYIYTSDNIYVTSRGDYIYSDTKYKVTSD